MIKDKIIYEFCKNHYYCDEEDGDEKRYLWEPFEDCLEETIESFIQADVASLKNFLKYNLEKEWDEQSN